MKIFGIIPARIGSTRLPEKVLLDIAGKPMIQRVYERARKSPFLDRLVVATDDDRIHTQVLAFGGESIKTSPLQPSGTDRVEEAARSLGVKEEDLVVNIQGDQPLFEPGMIDEVAGLFHGDPQVEMGVLVHPIRTPAELANPSVVKVVFDQKNFALYFSRSPMPYVISPAIPPSYYKHIGPYAYKMSFLSKFVKLERGVLEQWESLEQLRALEHGYRIKVQETQFDSQEVDTPQDLEKVRELVLKSEQK